MTLPTDPIKTQLEQDWKESFRVADAIRDSKSAVAQVIRELDSIDQKQIDANPNYFQTRQFIDSLINRLNEVVI